MDNKIHSIEKIIRIMEGAILTIIGILFLVFIHEDGFQHAISYIAGTILVIFGLSSIAIAFMLNKKIFSFDIIVGSLLTGCGITLFLNTEIINSILPRILSLSLLIYAISTTLVTIFSFINKNIKQGVISAIITTLLIGFGVFILVISFLDTSKWTVVLNCLDGIILIGVGIALILTNVISKKEKEPEQQQPKKIKKKKNKEDKAPKDAITVIDVESNDK